MYFSPTLPGRQSCARLLAPRPAPPGPERYKLEAQTPVSGVAESAHKAPRGFAGFAACGPLIATGQPASPARRMNTCGSAAHSA